MSYLAFDLGASSGKLFIGSLKGGKMSLKEVHRFKNEPIAIKNSLCWDFMYIYREMRKGIEKAVKDAGDDAIVSIGIDSFSNDFSIVSPEGELLTPIRCYRDTRTKKYEKDIYSAISERELYLRFGNQLTCCNTLMQLAAIELSGQGGIFLNNAKLLMIPDLLGYFLTGNMRNEFTLQSVSQTLSLQNMRHDEEVLQTFSIPKSIFPPIIRPGEYLGTIEEGPAAGAKVCTVCAHDTASAFICADEKNLSISAGTWALFGFLNDGPIVNDFGFLNNIANEGAYGAKTRIIKNIMGSWISQQAMKEFAAVGEDISYEHIAKLIRGQKENKYIIDVNDMRFFAPACMTKAIKEKCMEIYGDQPEGMAQVLKCISDSIAYKYFECSRLMEKFAKREFDTINIMGGGSADEYICKKTAQLTRKRVLAGPMEATAIGNIAVQLIADNRVSGPEEAREIILKSFDFKEYFA